MELYNKKLLLLLSFSPVVLNAENVSNSVKKNVIFIAVDDLRPELNCYGANHMFTPHIDEMAKQGIVFNRAYCNIPVSGASRASLMTGTRPTKNTFLNHKTVAEQQKPDKIALNDYLQSLGYRTEVRGKVFHNSNDHKDGWDMRHPSFPPQYLSEQNLKYRLKAEARHTNVWMFMIPCMLRGKGYWLLLKILNVSVSQGSLSFMDWDL